MLKKDKDINNESASETSRPEISEGNIAIIKIPLAEQRSGYCARHVDVQLSGAQPETLRRIVDGLDASQARLKNGKRVTTPAEAVRWLIEQVEVQSDESEASEANNSNN